MMLLLFFRSFGWSRLEILLQPLALRGKGNRQMESYDDTENTFNKVSSSHISAGLPV
jgi:hypothetical protein